MEKKYYPILLYKPDYENKPIISEQQSIEENTENLKRAIRHMFDSHPVLLDGIAYRTSNINEFIKSASTLCQCDKEMLEEYICEQKKEH